MKFQVCLGRTDKMLARTDRQIDTLTFALVGGGDHKNMLPARRMTICILITMQFHKLYLMPTTLLLTSLQGYIFF